MEISDLPPGRYFISHSYADADDRARLVGSLPSQVEPMVFAPITVEPWEFVSTPLVEAIGACDGLIRLRGGHSSESFWLAFEREFAVRANLHLYTWDTATSVLAPDAAGPTDLVIFPSHASRDAEAVDTVLAQMRARSFDMVGREFFGNRYPETVRELTPYARDALDRGGYVVVFHSRHAATSQWVDIETRYAMSRGRAVMAVLDGTPVAPVDDTIDRASSLVQLWDGNGLNANRIDDLIVRLCWLTYRNRSLLPE